MSLLIAGYPYIKEAYFKTFDSYPGKVYFLLPKIWKAKDGKLIFKPPLRPNVYMTKAFFYHSNYPIVGGAFKGWMPIFPIYLFRSRDINVVFSSSEPILLTTLYQGFWTKLFGKKHVIFSWENISYENKFSGLNGILKKSLLKLNLLFCDGIICGNRKAAKIFKNLTTKPIEVIPLSGVDSEFFRKTDSGRGFEGADLSGKIIFTFAGAIGYRKGLHLILESMVEVIKKMPNARLIIAGSGEYKENLSTQIKSLKLEENITLISWLDKKGLRELLSASDVFLYPSISFGGWEEQFGYSMAEASLMEVPVISTKTGSIDEVVLDGKTGTLINPNNVQELAQAMLELGSDNALRGNLGKAGRKHIEENFSYQIVAGKFYRFFESL